MGFVADEGDKRRCKSCKRKVHKDEILGNGCLICNTKPEQETITEGVLLE